MGQVLSVLFFSIGIVEGAAFIIRVRRAYLPIWHKERKHAKCPFSGSSEPIPVPSRNRRSLVGELVRGVADRVWSKKSSEKAKAATSTSGCPFAARNVTPAGDKARGEDAKVQDKGRKVSSDPVFPTLKEREEVEESRHETVERGPSPTLPMVKSPVPRMPPLGPEFVRVTKPLIFSGEYTKAMSKEWHSGHFCCWQCDESLTGQRYVLRDDHPYCVRCYESVFANLCEQCNKTIGIDSKDLSYKDKHWHEACFLCTKCRVSLVDKQFGSKADKIYCGNCYDAQFASRCDGCGEIFRAGTKKMEYKTRQWHEKCFCCCVCKTAIGTKSFIPREQEIYCATCYEEKFATRCVKCNKIITTGGVTYKNEPWHRECFTCTHCNTSLAGQRFTSRDEKPYCAECFGELFAKRCVACSRPITGIGGTRFISFEDRHWHNDCFICASCKSSLVGRGFITDGEDIICPECAKQKLM
ncbi:four and a half LIM domains protein 2 isoform X5 [Ischnura elegans]|uniref:four and a half LIM domains protein 2 isoform X5 n=1 Tax=Ischnura elegans TaxID=197161 RepID=UPI001ED881F2|nr:four and a half LIM domains protein 2 isoform X5 [Ischnura elegans]